MLGEEALLRPSADDVKLWDELNLRRVGLVPHGEWVTLGTVEVRPGASSREVWSTVTIEVSCWPARFWRFTVSPAVEDVQAVTLRTGSGSLADYWPTVRLFAGGMMGADGQMPGRERRTA